MKIVWQQAESQVFMQHNFSNIQQETIIEALLQRFEDNYPVNMRYQKSYYNCKFSVCSHYKNDPKMGFYCTKLTWSMLLKGKTIIWLLFMVLLQNFENSDFLLEVFLSPSFSAPVAVWPRYLRNE